MVVGTTIKARMIERTKETRPSRRNCFRGIFLKDKCFALGCTNKRFETRNRLHRKIDEYLYIGGNIDCRQFHHIFA
jgi:hypothetical protein